MADSNAGTAIVLTKRIEMLCDFMENPAVIKCVEDAIPKSMPGLVGSLGFDIPLWVGLGLVGLWAALDAFAERAIRNAPIAARYVEVHSASAEDLRLPPKKKLSWVS
jgi:hypothetical protein